MSVCNLCGGLGGRGDVCSDLDEPAPPPAYCGACRGAWGQCRCSDHVPSGVSALERWTAAFQMLTRSGTDPKVAARTAAEWMRGAR